MVKYGKHVIEVYRRSCRRVARFIVCQMRGRWGGKITEDPEEKVMPAVLREKGGG